MRPELRVLVLLAAFAAPTLAPLVAAHEGDVHPPNEVPQPSAPPEELLAPSRGYTGPGPQPYVNFYQGVWFYGSVVASPLTDQRPIEMVGDGDWLVWLDAKKNDIFAYNVPAGSGQYLTNDRALQRSPAISGNVVVWEDYRNSTHADVYAYFLDTGELRRISQGPGNHRNPDVRGTLIVWEDDRDRNSDIYAYDLENNTEFPIHVGPDRESDPVIVDGKVYFRTYRFNVWDIVAVDPKTGEKTEVTSDLNINGPPFTSGEDVYFHTQFFSAWKLDRYDDENAETRPTGLNFQDTSRLSASGDRLLATARDGLKRQLLAYNLTTGARTHVSGSLALTSEPILLGRTAYMSLLTERGLALLAVDISPFAFGRRPDMQILSPRAGAAWVDPIVVEGTFSSDASWTQPATFTYRINGGPPTAIQYAPRFRFAVDPEGYAPGRHEVLIRSTFREGPPIESRLILFVPTSGQGVDVEEAAAQFHAARVVSTMNEWVLQNPASYLVLVVGLFLVVLFSIRLWVTLKPRTERATVEYVAPDDG